MFFLFDLLSKIRTFTSLPNVFLMLLARNSPATPAPIITMFNLWELNVRCCTLKISLSTSSISKIEKMILEKINSKNSNKNIKRLVKIGNEVLEKNLFYINKYLI